MQSSGALRRRTENKKNKKLRNYQDRFLNSIREGVQVTIETVSSKVFVGKVVSFDQYVVILENEGKQTMIYKHAIAYIQKELKDSEGVKEEQNVYSS